MKLTYFFAALVGTFILAGCCNTDKNAAVPPCSVSPPLNTAASQSVKVQLAADLTKFAQAPVSASFNTEASRNITATFNKIPEKDNACAMLLQTYICIAEKPRATEFLQYVRSTGQCKSV